MGRRHHGADAIEQRRIDRGVVANFVDAAVHEVGGGHVELPEILGLPRSKRFGIDGLDVRVGHQRQHFQQRWDCRFFRQKARTFSASKISRRRALRHFQVSADEPQDRFALLGIEIEARQEAVGEFDALARMFAAAAAFAGIVQQQREQEEIEAVDFGQQLREALFAVMRGLAQAVHVVDGEEGVLVDGVAVVAVANDQRIDAVELGDQHLQDAERVHGAQRVRGVRAEQDFAQAFHRYGPSGM